MLYVYTKKNILLKKNKSSLKNALQVTQLIHFQAIDIFLLNFILTKLQKLNWTNMWSEWLESKPRIIYRLTRGIA